MDITSLKQQATTIRDENERSANSAARVGRAMLETVNAIEENKNNIATNATNIATNKAAIATNKAGLAALQTIYRGDIGDFTSWTEAQNVLDAMPSPNVASPNGQYQIRIGAVPFIVNYACLNTASAIYTQSVIGSAAIKSDGTLSTSHGIAVNIFSRAYTDGDWGAWQRLAALSDVPTPQEGTEGYEGKYIFSHRSDQARKVLSGYFKVINNNQKKVELQHRIWGATEYTSSTTIYTIFPTVTSSQEGMMDRYVYARLLNHTIQESGSTTTGVEIHYTNFASSGDRTFTITAASSAKAGVMTSAQYNQLTELDNYYKGLLGNGTFTTTDAFKAALNAMAQSVTSVGQTGRYRANVNGIIVYVTITKITSIDFAQWIEGPVIKSATDGDIYLNNELGVHLIGRVYTNGAWGQWRSTILDDELPLPASTTNDGLMSKEDYQLLQKIKAQLNL